MSDTEVALQDAAATATMPEVVAEVVPAREAEKDKPVSKDAEMQTDAPQKKFKKKAASFSSSGEDTSKQPMRPVPSSNTDTLVASFTTYKALTACDLLTDLTSGNIVFVNLKDIFIKVNANHRYKAYGSVEGHTEYFVNEPLLAKGIKLRYTSKAATTGIVNQVMHSTDDDEDDTTINVRLYACKIDGTPVTAADIQANKCWYYVVASNSKMATEPVFFRYIKANKKTVRM